MTKLKTILFASFLCLSVFQNQLKAQTVSTSKEVEFVNLQVKRCTSSNCISIYNVSLVNKNLINGSFKGVNNKIIINPEPNHFLVAIFNKTNNELQYQELIANPVQVDVEYAGADETAHQHDSNKTDKQENVNGVMEHKTLELSEGLMAVRVPFATENSIIKVIYIDENMRQQIIASF